MSHTACTTEDVSFEKQLIEETIDSIWSDFNNIIEYEEWIKVSSKALSDCIKKCGLAGVKYYSYIFMNKSLLDYSIFTDAIYSAIDQKPYFAVIYSIYLNDIGLQTGVQHSRNLLIIYNIIKYCLSKDYDLNYNEILLRVCDMYRNKSVCMCYNIVDPICHKTIYDMFYICRSNRIYDESAKVGFKKKEKASAIGTYSISEFISILVENHPESVFLSNIESIIHKPRTVTLKVPLELKMLMIKGNNQKNCLLNKLPLDVIKLIVRESKIVRNYDINRKLMLQHRDDDDDDPFGDLMVNNLIKTTCGCSIS